MKFDARGRLYDETQNGGYVYLPTHNPSMVLDTVLGMPTNLKSLMAMNLPKDEFHPDVGMPMPDPTPEPTPGPTITIETGDFDGDGDMDVKVTVKGDD